MDPNALLNRFLDALADGDRAEVVASLSDLQAWLAQGGFLPADPRDIRIDPRKARDLFLGRKSVDDKKETC